MISDLRRRVNRICALLGVYVAQNGSFLPTFRDNQLGPNGCPETSVRRKIPSKKAQTSNTKYKFSTTKLIPNWHSEYSPSGITVPSTFRSCLVSIAYDRQLRHQHFKLQTYQQSRQLVLWRLHVYVLRQSTSKF